jgi:hypothetical protein
MVAAVLAVSIPLIKVFDEILLSLVANEDKLLTLNIPGVHLEAQGITRRLHSVNSPPPYWLITILFGGLLVVIGRWLKFKAGHHPVPPGTMEI